MRVEKAQAALGLRTVPLWSYKSEGDASTKTPWRSLWNDKTFTSAIRLRGKRVNVTSVSRGTTSYRVTLLYFAEIRHQHMAKCLEKRLHRVSFRAMPLARIIWAPVQVLYHSSRIDDTLFSNHLPYILWCSYIAWINIYSCYIFFLDRSIFYYVVSFLASCNSILFYSIYWWVNNYFYFFQANF